MALFDNFSDVLDYLYNRLPMYQRVGPAAYKADLKNTQTLDRYFGHPHRSFRSVHIAGTNGKGSVAHMIASVCQSAGLKTALYTSPHLKSFTERIKINGENIPETYITSFFNKHYRIFEEVNPSFFEMTVLLAFTWFRDRKADIAIVETGMGGRLDSTNIITPLLSVITNIGLDHTSFLGDALPVIAREKAGIIKNNIPVVIGEGTDQIMPVFEETASGKKAPVYQASKNYTVPYGFVDTDGYQVMNIYRDGKIVYEKIMLDLHGIYQRKNVVTVVQSIDVMRSAGIRITDEHLYRGLAATARQTGLRGRWEILCRHPLIVADTAHNRMGLAAVLEQIRQTPCKQLFFVLGFVEDKELDSIIPLFPQNATFFFTRADVPRAMDASTLALMFEQRGIQGKVIEKPANALTEAKQYAGSKDMIFIGGSTFVVADIL